MLCETTRFLLLVCMLPLAYVTALPCDAGYTWSGTVCTSAVDAVATQLSVGCDSLWVCARWTAAGANPTLTCWGKGSDGQLGRDDASTGVGDAANEMGNNLISVLPPTGRTVAAVATGYQFTAVLLDDGTVTAFGPNSNGQLGRGNTQQVGHSATYSARGAALVLAALPTNTKATKIACGDAYVCALLDDGTVRCWGNNGLNQLGNGNTNSIGDGAGEMGNSLVAVRLPVLTSAVDVAAGTSFACAVTSDGNVYCWGNNNYGQNGFGTVSTPGQGGNANTLQRVLLPMEFFTSVMSVRCGMGFACVLTSTGQVGCWGLNNYGQLGRGDATNVGASAGEMASLRPIAFPSGLTAISISCGYSHVCAILSNNQIYCWGSNLYGKLGIGSTDSIGDNANEMGNALAAVPLPTGRTAISVSGFYSSTCAIMDNGKTACWGYGYYGLLGTGGTANRGAVANQMGNNLILATLPTASVSTCSAGAHYTGAACALCVEGAYTTTTTNVAGGAYDCTKCGAGTFSVTAGATLASTCGNCVASSQRRTTLTAGWSC